MLSARQLFRYSLPCRHRDPLWKSDRAAVLDDAHLLPPLPTLDASLNYARLWTAWSQAGLLLVAEVRGKRQPPWCRESRPEDSDGLRVWIDTRDTHNVHRATRFCHQFIFMPAGAGRTLDEPAAEQLLINRARENARPIRPGSLKAHREKFADGYRLEAYIPAAALTGFEPTEHPRLGFTYAVIDRELGEQTFSSAPEFPYREDPSLWATLELLNEPPPASPLHQP